VVSENVALEPTTWSNMVGPTSHSVSQRVGMVENVTEANIYCSIFSGTTTLPCTLDIMPLLCTDSTAFLRPNRSNRKSPRQLAQTALFTIEIGILFVTIQKKNLRMPDGFSCHEMWASAQRHPFKSRAVPRN
jgi:hypothetical protein